LLECPVRAALSAVRPATVFSFDNVTIPDRYHLSLATAPAKKYPNPSLGYL
jgi:hypothetical protein